ncbi:ATP-binding protein [Agromyces binzhouensis]|uniref:ATP-binding protein n=1 Tax=Agromyces binzhouensis TaxID=1817495 RepID=UPI0036382BF5
MRAVGYSLPTAISDVADNSIAAHATTVNVLFDGSAEDPYVAILDNGWGMGPESARSAMQLAGTNANEQRDAADLGRFGLGLKTASLSQCRRVTLITKRGGVTTALSWDLDVVEESSGWSLLVHEEGELAQVPHANDLLAQEHGTLVVWTKLDRLLGEEHDKGRYLDSQMELVRAHLSLVFHRFLTGDASRRVSIQLNYRELRALDPFLSKSKGTQVHRSETVNVGDERVEVQAYTLPYINRMSKREREDATTHGSLRDSQGFYIYRAGRLVVWGTWFRLTPKNEMGRLTRVRVDIPNSLDHLWSLDIKKSAAVPPTVVRNRLRELATKFVEPSNRIHTFRGRKAVDTTGIVRTWSVVEDRDSTRYEINRGHPALQQLFDALPSGGTGLLEEALLVIESTFPVQDVFNRMSNDVPVNQAAETPVEQLLDALVQSWTLTGKSGDPAKFVDMMMGSEPFNILVEYRGQALDRITQSSTEMDNG